MKFSSKVKKCALCVVVGVEGLGDDDLVPVVQDAVEDDLQRCGARIGCIISRNRELMGEAIKYCQARLSVATLDQVASARVRSLMAASILARSA
mgnify:CR=1 FL=1